MREIERETKKTNCPICWNPRIWMDTMTYGWSVECDFRPGLTQCLVLWGTNPAESDNSHFRN